MFEIPAALLSWFYGLTSSYVVMLAMIAAVVMAITTPLTLKSTKGMLEMQRLAPEMRKLQNEHRNDKAKLNEEMMKLYQEHKVNPMASCLPLVAQMPVFIIMFRVLHGLTYKPEGATLPVAQTVWSAFGNTAEAADPGFIPRFLAIDSSLYQALFGEHTMMSFGLDLSKSAVDAIGQGFGDAIPYVLLVVLLGGLYFVQQRMVAARAAISPTMSQTQQKLMQYLPVFFAVFQVFFLAALVVYYLFQTVLRIAQQIYITKAFYGHDEALGRQAQRAGEAARAEAQKSGESTGMFSQAKRDLASAKGDKADNGANGKAASGKSKDSAKTPAVPERQTVSKRVTPPKNRPTPSSSAKGRPTPSRKDAQPTKSSNRPNSNGKKPS
jgi:YidC/Oxa1 family membrane protein insertase